MLRIKKFKNFIVENQNSDSKFEKIKEDIKKRILDSKKVDLKSEGDDFIRDFIKEFLKDSKKYKIKGLESDSDIFQFYQDNSGDIDFILREIDQYEKSPKDLNQSSLYDYIIKSTEMAIREVLAMIEKDLTSEQDVENL